MFDQGTLNLFSYLNRVGPSIHNYGSSNLVLGAMGDRLKDLRDRALLLIGFAGGLRRSELAAINCIDIERVREGIILTIRRSKTDQDRVGRRIVTLW